MCGQTSNQLYSCVCFRYSKGACTRADIVEIAELYNWTPNSTHNASWDGEFVEMETRTWGRWRKSRRSIVARRFICDRTGNIGTSRQSHVYKVRAIKSVQSIEKACKHFVPFVLFYCHGGHHFSLDASQKAKKQSDKKIHRHIKEKSTNFSFR